MGVVLVGGCGVVDVGFGVFEKLVCGYLWVGDGRCGDVGVGGGCVGDAGGFFD